MTPVDSRGEGESAEGGIRGGDPIGIDRDMLGGAVKDAWRATRVGPKNHAVSGFDEIAGRVGADILEGIHPVRGIHRVGGGGDGDLALVGSAGGGPTSLPGLAEGRKQETRQGGDDGNDDKQFNQGKAANPHGF